MLQEKGGRGFPYFIFMNDKGIVLNSFRPSSKDALDQAMEEAKEKLAEYKQAKKDFDADPDDPNAQARWAITRMSMGGGEEAVADLKKALDSGKLEEDVLKDALSTYGVHLYQEETRAAGRKMREGGAREAVLEELYKNVYANHQEGYIPGSDASLNIRLNFWMFTGHGAAGKGDEKTYEKAVKKVEAIVAEDPRLSGNNRLSAAIEKLKQAMEEDESEEKDQDSGKDDG